MTTITGRGQEHAKLEDHNCVTTTMTNNDVLVEVD